MYDNKIKKVAMALYDYQCTSCGHIFEVEHPMAESPEITCPECKKKAQKKISASAIKFTGSGFYNTDSKN